MKTILFFPQLNGHHIEYLNHILDVCSQNIDDQFVLLTSNRFVEYSSKIESKSIGNVKILCMNINKEHSYQKSNSRIVRSFILCSELKRVAKDENADRIYANVLMELLPFAPFVFSSKISLLGIIYSIYLYEWKEMSFCVKTLNIFKYLLISYSKIFEHVLILNDPAAARRLNYLYNTNKFEAISDPILNMGNESESINQIYGLSDDDFVVAHFGGLDSRKGTLKILNSIDYLPKELYKKLVLFFAGKVHDEIKIDFYQKIQDHNQKIRIFVKDEFCDYSFLESLAKGSNVIMVPYSNTSQSSGLLGYAAYYNKPVIGPQKGLLGKLIKKYKLGVALDSVEEKNLASAILYIMNNEYYSINGAAYRKDNSMLNFKNTIRKYITSN